MSDIGKELANARAVESLLIAARDIFVNAQTIAEDGRLMMIGKWIGERIESLDDELLKEVRATVERLEALQKLQSERTGAAK